MEVTFTSGSKQFLEVLLNVIRKMTKVEGKLYRKDKNCYFIRYSYCDRAEKLLEWLYSNSTIHMSRKRRIYDSVC